MHTKIIHFILDYHSTFSQGVYFSLELSSFSVEIVLLFNFIVYTVFHTIDITEMGMFKIRCVYLTFGAIHLIRSPLLNLTY